MTVTLTDAREQVRLRLEDDGGNGAWTDAEIDTGLARALDEYGHRYPMEQRAEIVVDQGDTSVDLPNGARSVARVIDARGRIIPPNAIPLRGTAGSEQGWEVWGDRVEFTRALPEGTLELWYRGPRTFPDDSADPLPVPPDDVSLLALGAVTWCLEQRSVAEWKRGALPARYETVLRRAREEYQAAWRARARQVRTGRMVGTGT